MFLRFPTAILCIALLPFIWSCNTQTNQPDSQTFQGDPDHLLIDPPEHGYVTTLPPSKWEESMLTGNGTIGALVLGFPLKERIILSHEKLFMPENPPTPAPDLGANLGTIRSLVLEGKGEQASELAVQLGKEAGIEGMIWTNPLIPACQMEIEALKREEIVNYARSVNYETGEAITAWQTSRGIYQRNIFTSRPDGINVLKVFSPDQDPVELKLRLAQLPTGDSDEEEEFSTDELIEDVSLSLDEKGELKYITEFKKKWKGSLKGYVVESRVKLSSGTMAEKDGWLLIKDADEVLVLSRIILSYDLPIIQETGIKALMEESYESLLERQAAVQGEMFNRFSLELGEGEKEYMAPEELLKSSGFGQLQNDLVVWLCEAARYTLISSTGEIPPTLQGIWGGTWRPAWSGDFTLNGNVPSAIASGLNTNFQEVTEAYINYMYSFFDDFRDNAKDLYGAPGIFVPSRSSSSGKTYHYGDYFPHLFWFAGGAWTSQFFYDYWQYTGDEQFLKEKCIPFMMASSEFYEFIITKGEDGRYMFLPSYSPEVGPQDHHPLSINATMDIAALKQLLRNLLKLADQGYIESPKTSTWKEILAGLPAYEVDETGDLKEWIWPGLKNDNRHRHASHLYPLFYEVDPDFQENPELIEAAKTAIDNRLQYRRDNHGAEMAFGLVQKGLAAAHIGDTEHAYECVDWLCNSYWSPALTSYHDPGEIFNVDICGGLPAVVTEMLVQSSAEGITLLPALPGQWPEGQIRGVGTRCGVTIDLVWKEGKPVSALLKAHRNTDFSISFQDKTRDFSLTEGQEQSWQIN
jgi:alpha-L-fucosidase 2